MHYHKTIKIESHSCSGVLDTTLSAKVLSVTCCSSVVSSTNKSKRHNIIEILLKVALNTISVTLPPPQMVIKNCKS